MSATKKTSRFLPEHEDFSYEEFPFYWLARVHAIYSQEMEKVLKKLGTDIPTRRVLLMLRLHGTVSVSELATHAIIKLSTLTRIVQRMREEGLVETRTNADDARITDVLVTPKGHAPHLAHPGPLHQPERLERLLTITFPRRRSPSGGPPVSFRTPAARRRTRCARPPVPARG